MHATITGQPALEQTPLGRRGMLDPRLALEKPAPDRVARRRRLVTIFAWTCVAIALLLAGSWIIVGSMTRAAPAWWRRIDPDDIKTVQRANDLEGAISHHISMVRPGSTEQPDGGPPGVWRTEPWTVAMRAEDANAWLNVRLPVWMARENERFEWPEEMSDLQVHFDAPLIRIGAKVYADGREHYLSATLTPELREDGSLWVKADWVHVGRLPIPASWVLGEAEARAEDLIPEELRDVPQARTFFRIVAGEEPMAERPVVRLPDNRRVRLVALKAEKGWVAITCRTEYSPDGKWGDE
ncbi:MAG: hypothetical protein R3B57_05645 [Phycisphaerales bacterium]